MSLHVVEDETNPVIDAFLTFLAQDMVDSPSRITAISVDVATRMTALTAGIDVDRDDEIIGAVIP